MSIDSAINSNTSATTTTTYSSLRGRMLTLRLGGRGGLYHITARVTRNILCVSAVSGLSGTELSTARDGWAAELDRLLLVVDGLMLVLSHMLVFGIWLPLAEVVLGVVEDLPGLGAVVIRLAVVAWCDGGAVQELDEAAAMARQDDLLFGTLDRG